MMEKIISHPDPVWRDKANYLLHATFEHNELFKLEQIWCKHIPGNNRYYEICCIPFFAKDISLGDIVLADDNGRIIEVSKPSGHYTFRVWLGSSTNNTRDGIVKFTQNDYLLEWSSENLLAIDAPDYQTAQCLADMLQRLESKGELEYDTGRT